MTTQPVVLCFICRQPITDWDNCHQSHEPECPNFGKIDDYEMFEFICDCDCPCHPECCPECNQENLPYSLGITGEIVRLP